jgi:hypothetical protein
MSKLGLAVSLFYRSLVTAIETKLFSTWLAKSSTNFSSVAAGAGIVSFVPAVCGDDDLAAIDCDRDNMITI